jgi:hypothetical protein
MSAKDGVYYIRQGGRTFIVVPVHARNDKSDGEWHKGNQATQRGSLSAEEADKLLKELGCTKVYDLPVGVSPNGVAEQLVNGTSGIVPEKL